MSDDIVEKMNQASATENHIHLKARIEELQARVAELEAVRDEALIGKQRFQRTTRAHWEALCAMRNDINEYVEMPSVDSGPLFSPEDGPIYADIAKRVINKIQELKCSKQQEPAIGATINGPHGLGVNAQDAADELRARAEAAEALLSKAVKVGMMEGAKMIHPEGEKPDVDPSNMGDVQDEAFWLADMNASNRLCALAEDPETIARIVASLKEDRG